MTMRLTLVLGCLIVGVSAQSAPAAVIVLDCRVHAAKPGFERNGVRRLQLDLAAKSFTVSDNTGKGFTVRGTRPIVSVDGDRIVLENSGGKTSSVDRRSGQYVFRNEAEKLAIHGRCAPAGR